MEFDGYRIPQGNIQDKEYAWYAVLVWTGQRPNPKYNAKLENLSNNYFQNSASKIRFLVSEKNWNFMCFFFLSAGGGRVVSMMDMGGFNGGFSLAENPVKTVNGGKAFKQGNSQDCMQVGEVLEISRYGAIVSLTKNADEKAWIPGWEHSNIGYKGAKFLTTTQGKFFISRRVLPTPAFYFFSFFRC